MHVCEFSAQFLPFLNTNSWVISSVFLLFQANLLASVQIWYTCIYCSSSTMRKPKFFCQALSAFHFFEKWCASPNLQICRTKAVFFIFEQALYFSITLTLTLNLKPLRSGFWNWSSAVVNKFGLHSVWILILKHCINPSLHKTVRPWCTGD